MHSTSSVLDKRWGHEQMGQVLTHRTSHIDREQFLDNYGELSLTEQNHFYGCRRIAGGIFYDKRDQMTWVKIRKIDDTFHGNKRNDRCGLFSFMYAQPQRLTDVGEFPRMSKGDFFHADHTRKEEKYGRLLKKIEKVQNFEFNEEAHILYGTLLPLYEKYLMKCAELETLQGKALEEAITEFSKAIDRDFLRVVKTPERILDRVDGAITFFYLLTAQLKAGERPVFELSQKIADLRKPDPELLAQQEMLLRYFEEYKTMREDKYWKKNFKKEIQDNYQYTRNLQLAKAQLPRCEREIDLAIGQLLGLEQKEVKRVKELGGEHFRNGEPGLLKQRVEHVSYLFREYFSKQYPEAELSKVFSKDGLSEQELFDNGLLEIKQRIELISSYAPIWFYDETLEKKENLEVMETISYERASLEEMNLVDEEPLFGGSEEMMDFVLMDKQPISERDVKERIETIEFYARAIEKIKALDT